MFLSSVYWSLLFLLAYCPFFILINLSTTHQSIHAIYLTSPRNSRSSSLSHGGKKLATRSSNETSSQVKPKFFVPTNLLINKEIKVYIFDQEVKRFTFTVDSKLEAPLTLTVTPCSDPIKWTFEFIEDTDSKELVSLKKRRRHGKHGQSSNRHNRLRHRRHRHDGKQFLSPSTHSSSSPQKNDQQSLTSTSRLLYKYNGQDRKSFTDIRRQYAGQYVIQLSSTKRATSATLILSHFNPYPLLPVNDGLTILSSTDSSITLTWEQSPSQPDYPVDYYAVINQDHNIISYCEYLQQTESLLKYPSLSQSLRLISNTSTIKGPITLTTHSPSESYNNFEDNVNRLDDDDDEVNNEVINPTMSPFVRWYERTMAKTWESELSRKNWTISNIFHIESVGKGHPNYQHTFKLLQPSTRYYIDVIAAIKHTGRTSLYKGFNVTTKEKPKQPSIAGTSNNKRKTDSLLTKMVKLRDKRLVSLTLSKRNNFTEIMSYNYNESDFNVGGSLWLFIQVCSSSLAPVDVTIQGANPPDNSVLIKETGITGSRVINIPMGFKWYNQSSYTKSSIDDQQSMIISLVASNLRHNHHHPLEVTLMMTKKRLHIPYPQLPRDRTIRVLDLLSTCKSVSLAWIASPDEKARYCIYAAPIGSKVTESLIHNELKSLPGFTVNSTSPSFCESVQPATIKGGGRGRSPIKTKGGAKKQLKSNTKKSILDSSVHFKRLKCRRFSRLTNSRLNQIIIQDIDNLQPSTEYVFLIELVKSSKGLTAYYNPLTTSTKSKETC